MRVAFSLLTRRRIAALLGGVLALTAPQAEALEGLKTSASGEPRWQARMALGPARALDGSAGAFQLAGDRYLLAGGLGDGGGLRATGALLWGPRQLNLPAPAGITSLSTQAFLGKHWTRSMEPTEGAAGYLGVGYSTWWLRSGVGVSADLGLVSPRLGPSLRLSRNPAADDMAWRPALWTPVWQVSLSYSF